MAIVSFLQTFNVQLPLPVLSMTDNSDYYGQGINPNTITGSFKITLDGNVVLDHLSTYNTGSADIVGATSLTTQGVLQMALNPSGSAANGLYTILYKVWDSNTSTTSIITETFNFIYLW